jgi:hypothetical protein
MNWGVGLGIKNTDKYLFLFEYGFQKLVEGSVFHSGFMRLKTQTAFRLGAEFRPWEFRAINKYDIKLDLQGRG